MGGRHRFIKEMHTEINQFLSLNVGHCSTLWHGMLGNTLILDQPILVLVKNDTNENNCNDESIII
jgi:hypothetical protein